MRRHTIGLLAAATAAFTSVTALGPGAGLAASTTFVGGGGDELWTNPANWDNGVPAEADSVTITAPALFPVETNLPGEPARVALGPITGPIEIAVSKELWLGSPATSSVIGGQGALFSGVISGDGRIQFRSLADEGGSYIVLSGANTYTGGTSIEEQKVAVRGPSPFGTGPVVLDGTRSIVRIEPGQVLSAPITVERGIIEFLDDGDADAPRLSGGVELAGDSRFQVVGPAGAEGVIEAALSGPGAARMIAPLAGTVRLTGSQPNTNTGVEVGPADEMGAVDLVLARDEGVTSVDGWLSVGPNGTVTWEADDQVADDAAVVVEVGNGRSAALVLGGHTERIGDLQVRSGNVVLGAAGGGGLGMLLTGDVTLGSAARLTATIDGGDASRIVATGTVTVDGAALQLLRWAEPAGGAEILLVDNDGDDPVFGTFAGLAEGAGVDVGGRVYRISYTGGDGNDITLTVPPAYESIVPVRILETRTGMPGGQVGYTGPKPAPGDVVQLQVAGVAEVPADAAAVVLNVTGVDASADGFVTVWPCGVTRPNAANLNLLAGDVRPNLVVAKIGSGGKVCLYTQSGTHLVADLQGWYPAGTYSSIAPVRVLETRTSIPGGQVGYAGDVPAAQATVELSLDGIVPLDSGGVVINLTATEAIADGFVTVWPCGADRPFAANLNVTAGGTSPNLVFTSLGIGGKVCIYTQSGTHLVGDLQGWFPAGTFDSRPPVRVLDTRPDVAGGQVGYSGAKPAAGDTVALRVVNVQGVPPDVIAVALNVTATEATADGFVTVWPCGAERPMAANLNVTTGGTIPNLVLAKPGADGTVCLYTQSGTHLVADLQGWHAAS